MKFEDKDLLTIEDLIGMNLKEECGKCGGYPHALE